ncbi:MAG TPA: deoxyhypusine synthase family protein [Candidatus Moranbacteria bacterium]|nr:deoxyhypusine synthase family protein [Candidatus Moranbacteria bacterium]
MADKNHKKSFTTKKPTDFKAVKRFIDNNFFHFNAAVVKSASEAYLKHLNSGGKMFLTLAGAMSTAEIGITLAEMIRKDKVHAICCTGANLEEDIFNLVAHDCYKKVPDYRYLSRDDEEKLLKNNFNRVTDTCIPEEEAMRKVEEKLYVVWGRAEKEGKRFFPYEYIYQLIREERLKKEYQIDPKNSWVIAACQKNIPIFTAGWEDSTLGNEFVAEKIRGRFKSFNPIRGGLEVMEDLIGWYKKNSKDSSIGFFQIGGGISGDFPICVVPLIQQDLMENCRLWGYFCQISNCTTSYGSYSGAVPNEKITWGKIGKNTPQFVIESDASIVAPLIFAYILGYK